MGRTRDVSLLGWGLGVCGVAGLAVAGLRAKMKAGAILQDGAWAGSAQMAPLVSNETASFSVVRGAPGFREQEPFVHRGRSFLIVGYASVDTRSTVLRRFTDVSCRIVPSSRDDRRRSARNDPPPKG